MPPDEDGHKPARRPGAGRGLTPAKGEVYIEFKVIGQTVKVTAVDAATGTEVSIQGPATTSQKILQKNALAKLNYVLGKTG